jgi:RNA polymerase sigma-70 factor (ECF subfamily)
MSAIGDRLRERAAAEQRFDDGRHLHVSEQIDSQLESLSDSELVTILKDGAQQALGVLFVRYRRLVLSISLRILRDEGEAEDIVQDVFLEISKKAKTFKSGRGTVKMWILQYAYSRSFDRRRYLALRGLNRHYSNGNGTHLPEQSVSPQALNGLTLEERGSSIRKALNDLLPRQKQVIELAYFQGFEMKEIAEQLGETLGNVRHHYYRGLKKLQQILGYDSSFAGK